MKLRQPRRPNTATVQARTEAKQYEENAILQLRNAGYRITMPRVQVIRALAETKTALSAYQVHEKILSGGGMIDVVSVYRILGTLQEVGVIYHIGVADGYFPCRIEGATERSGVVYDEVTHDVKEIAIPDSIVSEIQAQVDALGTNLIGFRVEVIVSKAKKK